MGAVAWMCDGLASTLGGGEVGGCPDGEEMEGFWVGSLVGASDGLLVGERVGTTTLEY